MMLVKNVQPRLIRIDGIFIAPGETAEVDESAVGLTAFLSRGVLVEITSEPETGDKKGATEGDISPVEPNKPTGRRGRGGKPNTETDDVKQSDGEEENSGNDTTDVDTEAEPQPDTVDSIENTE